MTAADREVVRHRPRPRGTALVIAIGLIALGIRLWAPGPTTQTYDESLWMHRAAGFATALADGDLAHASAEDPDLGLTNPTMPGITTIWAGLAGRGLVQAGSALGLTDPIVISPVFSPQVLRAAQGVVALVCSALLVLMMVLVRRLFDLRTALFAGGVLAVEPWVAALSMQLHTDAMVAMFSITALCGFAWALRAETPRGDPDGAPVGPPRRGWLVGAALLATGALLTKANAAGILAPGAALVWWDAWRHRYRGRGRELGRAALPGLVAAAAVAVVAWPALLVAPFRQIELVTDASGQVGRVRLRWFDGHLREFIPHFHAVALAFRLTPWMILWCLTGIVAGVGDIIGRFRTRRSARPTSRFGIPAWLILTPVPYLVALAISRFGYDRYTLGILPFWVIAGARVASRASRRLPASITRRPTLLAGLGVGVLVAASVVPLRAAPFGSQWSSPLFGGQRAAARWIPTEGGQASSRLDAELRRIVEGDCAGVVVADAYWHPAVDRCGAYFSPFDRAELQRADYAMSFQVGDQRPSREWYRPWLVDNAELVHTVTVDGVVFGELWRLPGS